ncbi:MAG: TerC family protein [Blastocatellia bacterium]|nr:TerC family protein [Blastocatellia bacterium]
MDVSLFPFSQYWWFYPLFTGFVLFLLVLDLGIFHRTPHKVTVREAATWSVVWVSLALLFNLGLYGYARWVFASNPQLTALPGFHPEAAARQVGIEFLTGYVIEKSLSIDNLFVFIVIFGFFAVPEIYQHRILFYGIVGALLFRTLFIAGGAWLMQFHWMMWLFGGFLIFTGVKMLMGVEHEVNPEKNWLIRLFRRLIPVTSTHEGKRFFVRRAGRLHATPLFVTLLFVEATDIIFAVDSVPAIFAVTREPLIVFTSNIFAILGLRSLYFLLAGMVGKFHLLKYGLAAVLIFVGLKMTWLNNFFGGKFPIGLSLAIIGTFLALAVALSWLFPKPAVSTESVSSC